MTFKTEPLEQVCDLVVDCPHSTPTWLDEGIVVIRNTNIRNGRLDFSKPSFTNEENYLHRSKRAEIQENDIIFTREAPMGEVCIIPKGLKACLGQRQVLLRAGNDINPKYLFYALQSSYVQHQVSWNEGTGTTVSNIRIPFLKQFLIPRNENSEDQIAHILSTLDDKIELNRKMNETLEAMAQALFKSWFVDFDPVHLKAKCTSEEELEAGAKELGLAKEVLELFPSAFVESEMGMIPEGWSWQKITEVCSRIGSGGTPKRKEDDNFNGSINWFTTKELKNGFVLHSIETITDKGLNTSSAKLFPINTVVMAIYAAPTVGRLGILTEESTFNQAACGFVADEEQISYEFLFLYLQDRNSYLNNLANGAAQQNLNVGLVKNLNVPIPSKDIMGKFKAIGEHLFSQLRANTVQIDTLQKTRDTLLPKLLSGELDVSEVEI